ncbi:hypothetical protein AB0B76_39250, partial [Dactylosporangium sp. NPDC049140]
MLGHAAWGQAGSLGQVGGRRGGCQLGEQAGSGSADEGRECRERVAAVTEPTADLTIVDAPTTSPAASPATDHAAASPTAAAGPAVAAAAASPTGPVAATGPAAAAGATA